ncbi:conserved oligomeric Golgi complex subunit 5-like isoform X1 [Mya arenaria]|uniref:conserved oligomeric Golgi complex subunit 5-like isoform X1 n=1 Tax=Mya arenaria TaxID=6604 RepID=UPI0022E08484|nr:conserved oligomeric Golgi complex subunit 5-like isoform X1 [Mya arenaria]
MEDELISLLENDDMFAQFLQETFDVKSHANKAIQGAAITDQLAKLAEGIGLLDKEIHSQIVVHHEDLLSQATGVETLEGMLQMMQSRIQSLLAAMDRIRTKVTEPYTKILTRTVQLRNLQETCDLLRRIIRILYLSKRLHSQLAGGAREITKAAQSLNELDYICEGVDLTGIEVIEQDRRFVKQARNEVETQAQKMLEQGMESQNQVHVATSLQVFHNLGCLREIVDRVVKLCSDHLEGDIKSCLDVTALSVQQTGPQGKSAPGRSSMPMTGNTAALRATLWTNMEKLMDSIYSACAQVQHLQKVLIKKRDPVTHVCFIEELKQSEGSVHILADFWTNITALLKQKFNKAAETSSFLKQAFEGEYPKLLRLYNDLWKRLQQFSLSVETDSLSLATDVIAMEMQEEDIFMPSANKDKQYNSEQALRDSLSDFETAYISKSLSRLFDPINLAFSTASFSPPSIEEVDNIVKTISSELNVASVDKKLCVTVAKNVSKTVKMYCVKSEQLLCTDGEASQVIGSPTQGQTRNAAVVNTLYQLHLAVSKVVIGLEYYPEEGKGSITESLQAIVLLMTNAVQPLMSSICDALEAIILTIHQEDFSSPAPTGQDTDAPCSLYMRELQGFIARCQTDYLLQFTCHDFIMECIQPISCRCISLFVRHACMVRPLGEGGKLRLAADFAQMELAISPFCKRASDLGKPYRLLRAFRPLLFQSVEHVSDSPALGETIPHSTLLHFLFARAPPEIKSPHVSADWSLSRYSQWLDDHPSEKDRLTFIKGCLEAYVQQVRSRHGKEFAAIYPIMLKILQNGLQNTS